MTSPQSLVETSKRDDPTSADVQYADVLELLTKHGYVAGIADTGGGCASIEIIIDDDHRLLATDKDDLLAWERANHHGWGVGLYKENDEMTKYQDTDDSSAKGLLSLVKELLSLTQANTVSA